MAPFLPLSPKDCIGRTGVKDCTGRTDVAKLILVYHVIKIGDWSLGLFWCLVWSWKLETKLISNSKKCVNQEHDILVVKQSFETDECMYKKYIYDQNSYP